MLCLCVERVSVSLSLSHVYLRPIMNKRKHLERQAGREEEKEGGREERRKKGTEEVNMSSWAGWENRQSSLTLLSPWSASKESGIST